MLMQTHSLSISSYLATIAKYRDLIAQLIRREFQIRFRGATLGVLWAIITPFVTVLMFAFVFGVIFKSRWGGTGTSTESFIIIVLIGMTVHGILAEALGRAPTAILGQPTYVKKVVFPLEIIPIVVTANAVLNAAITLLVVLTASAIVHGGLETTVLLLPIVLLPYVVLIAGVVLFVSAIGVYIRDMSQIVTLVTMLTLFLSPIFYPISAVPEGYRFLLYLNPLTFIVEQTREVALFGHLPDWAGLAVYALLAFLFAWLGYCWFQKSRNGFADVI
jgi:lipopolysaccharide transport system permease protein